MKKASCIFSIILCLLMSCMIPFSISADQALSAPFVGINIHITGYEQNQTSITYPTINIGTASSANTGAQIIGKLECSSPVSSGCDVYSFASSSGNTSNGTSIKLNLQSYFLKLNGNATINSNAFYFIQYEFVLDSHYVGWVTFEDSGTQYTKYINGTSFNFDRIQNDTTEHTISIVDYELNNNYSGVWDFPIESFNFIGQMLSVNSNRLSGFDRYNQYTFPLFDIKQGDQVFKWRLGAGAELTMIFFSDLIINTPQSISNAFTISDSNIEMTFDEVLMYAHYTVNNKRGRLSKYTIRNNGSGLIDFTLNANMDFTIMPVFCNQEPYNAVSTDFALVFGLSNDFLDAVVYGTEQSNQSSSDLDDSSDNMNNQMQDLIGVEDSYNEQFNNSLQNIDFTSPAGNQNLLSSANFVITVFNGLIQNNFLSTLIIIICILIIGKKVIGK